MTRIHTPPQRIDWIGKPEVMREDWSFWFSSNPEDWYSSKHLRRNRKNKYRYIKKKK